MAARLELQDTSSEPLPGYRHILLAADSSDHANQGTREAVALARLWGAGVTAAHVYAAKMHDLRFRQMEGGLPEQFRQEQELERQRDVHDDLITRGLSIITDCYLDQAERACRSESVDFARCSLEGKNYRELVKEANSGKHDPVAFAAWDGSNSESGSRHTLTTWYWLLLKPAAGNTPLLAAVAAFVLILLAEIGWARSASRKAGTARG